MKNMSETVSSFNDAVLLLSTDTHTLLLEINLSSKYLLYIKMHAYTNESHIKHKALRKHLAFMCNPLPCVCVCAPTLM